jgi:hypothetical protein
MDVASVADVSEVDIASIFRVQVRRVGECYVYRILIHNMYVRKKRLYCPHPRCAERPNSVKNVKVSLLQAVEAHRVARG